jgi:hypothetical protein
MFEILAKKWPNVLAEDGPAPKAITTIATVANKNVTRLVLRSELEVER